MYYQKPDQFAKNLTFNFDNEFWGTDSREAFQKHLTSLPQDWHYRTKQIEYTVNSECYRTAPFDQIDWNNSVVVFGCSVVFGEGLAQDETLCYQLERLIGVPVINMGLCASSMFHSYYNQVCLLERGFKPKAIVHAWSGLARVMNFNENHTINIGPWSREQNPEYAGILKYWNIDEYNPGGFAWFVRRLARTLAPRDYFDLAISFKETARVLDCDFVPLTDKARDQIHPGPDTMKVAAQLIANNLKFSR